MNDTNYLISSQQFTSLHCADINSCHSDLFPSQTELKVIGHHHAYVRPKLKVIGRFVRRPCKRYFKACDHVMYVVTFLQGWCGDKQTSRTRKKYTRVRKQSWRTHWRLRCRESVSFQGWETEERYQRGLFFDQFLTVLPRARVKLCPTLLQRGKKYRNLGS